MAGVLGNDTVKPGRARETLVLRHIADYALFMSGVFRERLKYRGRSPITAITGAALSRVARASSPIRSTPRSSTE